MEIDNGDANTLPFIIEEEKVSNKDHTHILEEFYLLMSRLVDETDLNEKTVYDEVRNLMEMPKVIEFEFDYENNYQRGISKGSQ